MTIIALSSYSDEFLVIYIQAWMNLDKIEYQLYLL